ncbi:hypothetical protein ACFY36_08270 [Actinoplanes sp. NPDC000266]
MLSRASLLLIATVLLAGCTGPEATAAAPSPSPSAAAPSAAAPSPTQLPPKEAVKAALRRLSASTYTYTVSGDYWTGQKYRASGAHDPQARKDSRTFTISGGDDAKTRKVILIGDESYENRDGNSFWTHAYPVRLKPANPYRYADPKDPGGLARFTAAIHNARRLTPGTYQGEARLETKPSELTYVPLGAPVFRFAKVSTWVKYTVNTDAKGDVSAITLIFGGDRGPIALTTTYSKIGQPVRISEPTSVRELRRSLY